LLGLREDQQFGIAVRSKHGPFQPQVGSIPGQPMQRPGFLFGQLGRQTWVAAPTHIKARHLVEPNQAINGSASHKPFNGGSKFFTASMIGPGLKFDQVHV
jgi:hypothetical protein